MANLIKVSSIETHTALIYVKLRPGIKNRSSEPRLFIIACTGDNYIQRILFITQASCLSKRCEVTSHGISAKSHSHEKMGPLVLVTTISK
jgi:hypothetical protein